jgi:hypothetical protein
VKCGQEVQIVDWNGAIAAVAVSQCGGGFLMIVYATDWQGDYAAPFRNGERLFGWEPLLDRLVWLIAHPGSREHSAFSYAARTAGGMYAQVLLDNTPGLPVLAGQLAAVLEADPDEVRARLRDYLVIPPEPVGEP